MISYIFAVITGIAFFIFDRYTKDLVSSTFILSETKDFIPGLIDFTYIHNRGGAWGMLSGYTWLLVIPVAYCLSHFTNWSIVPVFFCVQSMEFVKAIIGFFMVKSNVWLNTIVKDS